MQSSSQRGIDEVCGLSSAETWAKVALLAKVTAKSETLTFVASEVALDAWSIRADLVVGLRGLTHAYEIKTEVDTLARLPRQLAAYRQAFDRTTVVVATRHLARALSIIPDDVGVMELKRTRKASIVVHRRSAKQTPVLSALAMSRLIPIKALAKTEVFAGLRFRAEAERLASTLSAQSLRHTLVSFLSDRYGASTQRFLARAYAEGISPSSMQELHIWPKSESVAVLPRQIDPFLAWLTETDQAGVFGEVPQDIKALVLA